MKKTPQPKDETTQRVSAQRTGRTQTERKEEAEVRMLSAAERIIALRGVERLTLADVGVEAGYSRGLPTHHFGTRQALLRAVTKNIQSKFLEQLEDAAGDKKGLTALDALIRYYFGRKDPAWISTRVALAMLVSSMQAGSEITDLMSQYNKNWNELIEGHIQYGISNGEIRSNVDVPAYASLIYGAMRGVMLQYLVDQKQVDLIGVCDSMIQTYVNPLKKPPQKKAKD